MLVATATGSGKTHITSAIIGESVGDGRCLYIADSNELVQQPVAVIQRVTGIIPAVDQSERKASLNAEIVVASAQTLSKKARLERYPRDHFHRIVCDEAHRGAKRDAKIMDYFSEAKVCGCTATPFKSGLRDLSEFYERVCYSMPMLNLVDEGFAPKMTVLQLPVEVDLEGCKTSMTPDGRDYNADDLDTKISPHYAAIARLWKEHAANRQTIVFLPLKKSAFEFTAICRSMGITAQYIAGDSPDRAEILAKFEACEFKMLVNASVLSTGVDIATADCLLSISPTHSMSLYQQRVGRIMRPLPGLIDHLPEKDQAEERRAIIAASAKPDALILDLLFEHDTLGSIHSGHLLAQDEDQARRIFDKSKNALSPQDLMELARKTQLEKEKHLVQELERAARKSKVFEPHYVGILLNSRSIATFDPVQRWELEPASEKQVAWLQARGIASAGITKGLASKIFTEMIHRFKHGMATLKQVSLLRERGVENAHLLSFKDASEKIGRVLANA